jgi:hypothetical protein
MNRKVMMRAIEAAAIVAGLAVVACAPPQPLSADPRVVVQARAGVVADAPMVVVTSGQMADVSVPGAARRLPDDIPQPDRRRLQNDHSARPLIAVP